MSTKHLNMYQSYIDRLSDHRLSSKIKIVFARFGVPNHSNLTAYLSVFKILCYTSEILSYNKGKYFINSVTAEKPRFGILKSV
jgi:hypothetical protein